MSVTYGNGLFVAVAITGSGNRVMTSSDGIFWFLITSAGDNAWRSVTYGNGLFVAVADTGIGNRVMTSTDGIYWILRRSAANNGWRSVTYGNGLFVAVADTGTGNRVMTSPDGIDWTSRTSAADYNWTSVTYGNGLFVAVSNSGVMTSPDGIDWTSRTSAADYTWTSVTYGNGLFVAVSNSGVMTSPDGITWTLGNSAVNNNWTSVTYGNGLFAAVSTSGTGNRVMTADYSLQPPTITDFSIPSKTYGDVPFIIPPPTSNSSGSFSYTSSDESVATISGNILTVVGPGNSTITANQAASGDYSEGSATTPFQVNASSPTNPVIIDTSEGLAYFLNTTSTYANIIEDVEITEDLVAASYKVLSGNNITIVKSNVL